MSKDDNVLNQSQRQQLRNDMDSQVEMLSDDETDHLARLLNQKVEIPFLPIGKEHIIVCKLVRKVDRYLYEILPNELYSMVKSTKDGLSTEHADQLREIITTRGKNDFSIRFLPESVEQQIFIFLCAQIIRAMHKNMSVLKL